MKKVLYIAFALILALGLVIPLAGCGAVGEPGLRILGEGGGGGGGGGGEAGTTLSADVTHTGYWTITYGWAIDKSVTPDTWDLFGGDTGTSNYTICVTKDSGTVEAWVEGTICVTNGGDAVATEDLAITVDLMDGYAPPRDFLTSATVDVSGNPVLDPGESFCYPYRIDIPITDGEFPQPHAGGVYKVTAHVTITNHSGHLGEPYGPSPSSLSAEFPGSPTLINNCINVDDTNGGSWEFCESGCVSYEKTFTCADEGTNDNTATIRETRDSDGASVTVNCYALEVAKTAETSFDRTYDWTIDKSADQSELELEIGGTFDVNYDVLVDAAYTDSDWAVSGNISVYNPAPIAATINSVSDIVSPDIPGTVDCGCTFPFTLAAGETLECTYSAALPDASTRDNVACATLQNYDYDWEVPALPSGTTDFCSEPVPVDFTSATITHIDECVDVTDSYAGSLGTVCWPNVPGHFYYTRTMGPYEVPGDYTVENTASFETNDTGSTGSDSWTVIIHVLAPPAGTVEIRKFYDTNVNHEYDAGEPFLSNWPVSVDGTGYVTPKDVELEAGEYTVCETVLPGWTATTPTCVDIVLEAGETETVYFGNICLKPSGGKTLGFWSNKNGQKLVGADDLAMLSGLILVNGGAFHPTSYSQLRTWLLSATATNMAYMLSAQLAAMELNVLNGFVDGGAFYIPYGGTINNLMAAANSALGADGYTPAGDPNRGTQEFLKNCLDALNNGGGVVSPTPCPIP